MKNLHNTTDRKNFTKSKNLVVRVTTPVYNFVAEKSKEYGLTKTQYIFSQFDEESEFHQYLDTVLNPEMDKELERVKEVLEKLKAENKELQKQLLEGMKNASESDFIKQYNSQTDIRTKRKIRTLAKKRNIDLPD